MSDASGIPLLESKIEEKFEYKGVLYPKLKKLSSWTFKNNKNYLNNEVIDLKINYYWFLYSELFRRE